MSHTQASLDALLKGDLLTFGKKTIMSLEPGIKFQENFHHQALAYRLNRTMTGETKRLAISIPPRSGKSMFSSVALPAYMLAHDPGARIILVSYSQELVTKHARNFRRVIEMDWYKRIAPNTDFTTNRENIVETAQGGMLFATSVGGTVTGLGAHTIVVDDPTNPQDAMSEQALEKANQFYSGTLLSRLDKKDEGVVIIVMQRLHENDLIGYVQSNPAANYEFLTLPAIAQQDEVIELGGGRTHFRREGDLLHPGRESQAALDMLKAEMGSGPFSAQYLQSPQPADGAMVKLEWIRDYSGQPDKGNGRIIQSWDTALKGDASCDYSVCTTWLERGNEHFLLDVFREKLNFPDLVHGTLRQHDIHRPEAVIIEEKGSGISLLDTLRYSRGVRAIGRVPTDDKITRLNRVLPMFEAGQVFLPKEASWRADLLKELLTFPSAMHDDQVDSISQYLTWAGERGRGSIELHFI